MVNTDLNSSWWSGLQQWTEIRKSAHLPRHQQKQQHKEGKPDDSNSLTSKLGGRSQSLSMGFLKWRRAHQRHTLVCTNVSSQSPSHCGAARRGHRGQQSWDVTKLDSKVEMPLAAAWAQLCNSADLECEVPLISEPTLIVRMKIFTTEQQLDNAQSPIPPPHSPYGPGKVFITVDEANPK